MIQQISIDDIFSARNVSELFAEYAEECSIPLIGKIDPQPRIYEVLEHAGMLACFGAYEGKRLIGFATVLTTILPHYGRKVATMESLFVEAQSRAGGVGNRLIEEVARYAKDAGCEAILYSARTGSKLERLLSLKGYSQTNSTFARKL